MPTYFADLNPRFPSRFARRWAVMMRVGDTLKQTHLQFTKRAYAERAARRLNEANAPAPHA